jgi:aminoglycoside phosphotransferase (APT) family kinase protein
MNHSEVAELGTTLERFIGLQLPGESSVQVIGLRRASAGNSRENWVFDAKWDEHGVVSARPLLLRRDPPGGVVETPRRVEFELLRVLHVTAVPVPEVLWIDESGEHFGRPSLIMQRCDGAADRSVLRGFDPLRLGAGRVEVARELAGLLAAVHGLDLDSTGIGSILPWPVPNPAESELAYWLGMLDEQELEPHPALRLVGHWLAGHPPAPRPLTLVHGDFRPGNALVRNGHVAVMLDWELARIGDPVDDLGWYTVPMYRREHFIPGSWEPADFLAYYGERTGRQVPAVDLEFWQVMAGFRLAVMGVMGIRSWCEGRSDRPPRPVDSFAAGLLAGLVS